MHIGIATDIYGKQEGLDRLAFSLRSQGAEVSLISPYENSASPGSGDEQEVYAAFVEQCGHAHYSKKIFEVLHQEGCNVAIGFSAGASAMWRALADSSLKSLHHFLGFYPTRIRKYLDCFPQTPTTLVFPYFEEVVNVDELIKEIAVRGNICCLKAPYLHGFFNPLSVNYSVAGKRDFTGVLSTPEILGDPVWCRKRLRAICGK
ncbi:hypothetical protein [Desulfopila inferna]|uniref:hypothetical protein n=1 Tax=Desulfopila inferna TaxID=468528 RepID=UPI0019649633|nr:hypothetical protein [Desulfopila inferna]MBM9603408.1 hypothetical protein [Desulfopila inferna]